MPDSRAEVIEDVTAELREWYDTYDTEIEMDLGGLLLIFEAAPQQSSQQWRETGAINALTENSPHIHHDGEHSIKHPEQDLPFDSSYVYRTLAQTWEIQHNTEIADLPVVDPLWVVPFAAIENPGDSFEEYGEMKAACEQFLVETGLSSEDGNLKREPHIQLITGALEALITDIEQSLYTEREFLALHLSPTHTYAEIAELFEQLYGTTVTPGTVQEYNSRAERKYDKARQTIDIGQLSPSISDLPLQPREHSLLTERDRRTIINEIRTAQSAPERHSDTYLSFELGQDYTLSIEVFDSGNHISILIGSPLAPISAPLNVEGDATDVDAYDGVVNNARRETSFESLGDAECDTARDLWETLSIAVTPGIGMFRSIQARNVFEPEDDTETRVSFGSSVHMDEQTDSEDSLLHGHKYRWPGRTGIDEDDEIFTVVQNHTYDVFVQYESGYATSFGSMGQSDSSMRSELEYIGPGNPQPQYPCQAGNHDFGNETYPNPDKQAICSRCGYSIDSLIFTFQDLIIESLPFNCDCCDALTPPSHRNLIDPDVLESGQICDGCWNTEYFPQVDLAKEALDNYIITCYNFATSYQQSNYVHPSEASASCTWIGRATPDQVQELFEEHTREHAPKAAKPCPGCEHSDVRLFRIIHEDELLGHALRDVMGDNSEVPIGEDIFTDGEPNAHLTSTTHNKILDRYHELEQA